MTTLAASRRAHIGVEAGPSSAVGRSGVSFFRSVREASEVPRLGRVITTALRSLWAEPRATDAPERVSRDWVLVGVLMVTVLLEGVFRDDVAWRPFAGTTSWIRRLMVPSTALPRWLRGFSACQ